MGRRASWGWRLAALALLLGLVSAAPASAGRFGGWAEGYYGKDHNFIVGDGFHLVFVDRKKPNTHYRVCWHRTSGGDSSKSCWDQKSGKAGSPDSFFVTSPDMGHWVVRWTVAHKKAAVWDLDIGIGD